MVSLFVDQIRGCVVCGCITETVLNSLNRYVYEQHPTNNISAVFLMQTKQSIQMCQNSCISGQISHYQKVDKYFSATQTYILTISCLILACEK